LVPITGWTAGNPYTNNIKTTTLKDWEIRKYNDMINDRTTGKAYTENKHISYRIKFKNITQPKTNSLQKWPRMGGADVLPMWGRRRGGEQTFPHPHVSHGAVGSRTATNDHPLSTSSGQQSRKRKGNENTHVRNNTATPTAQQHSTHSTNMPTTTQRTKQETQQTQPHTTIINNYSHQEAPQPGNPDTEPTKGANVNTFLGTAGPPRGLALCGDQNPDPSQLPQRHRNTKRGLRSNRARENRREKRTKKRREARREHRRRRQLEKPRANQNATTQATAQEPRANRLFRKLELGKKQNIATLNIRGVKKVGVREEVEKWMKKHSIKVLALQETRNSQNTRETRKGHTWFFSGEGGRETYTAGVALVIDNEYLQFIDDLEPINDRIMYITLKGTIKTTIVSAYAPTADRTTEEKEQYYLDIQQVIDKKKSKGPLYILGDWNARLIYPQSENEEHIMGKHTMHEDEDPEAMERLGPGMLENRELLTELCMTNELRIVNTMYRKTKHKTATYRIIKERCTEGEPEMTNRNFEQIDYIITTRRWRNTVMNAESDTKANINSDHFPVKALIRIKLRRDDNKGGPGRDRYKKCTEEQHIQINNTLEEHMDKEQETQNEETEDTAPSNLKEWIAKGIAELPKEKPKDRFRKHALSDKTKQLLEERGRAAKHRKAEEFDRLTKAYRKSRKDDRKERVLEAIGKDLDLRDRWLGIRELKSKYNPTPYHNKDSEGKHVEWKDRAQKAAEYLSTQQWGKTDEEETTHRRQTRNTNRITQYEQWEKYRNEPPTLSELKEIIKKLKRRKAAGPDEIPIEILKELTDKNLKRILKTIIHWWTEENISEEELKARVVLIYKKGDTNNFANYRPISLLNTLYKVIAAILQKRISETLDRHLQKTQYGFRKDKSTGDAIHLVRRVIEYGESTKNQLHLLLLDWEKAFDKVDREALMEAMQRMGVDEKLIRIVRSLYKNTTFKVEIDGNCSKWETQHTGIRQGCPLSPYLFLIVMTVMFHDVHEQVDDTMKRHRVPGAEFDEVTYADDTICISRSETAMNLFVEHIEREGLKYGMKLNKNKCELITTHETANIKFADGTKIRKTKKATYLGCEIGIKTTNKEELSKRFANTMATMKKLDLFWRHSNCTTAMKIHTAEAVLRAKLLYGLESAQLIPSVLKRVETFQLKVLRKILKMDTTYINRANTNNKVYATANQQLQEEGSNKTVTAFTDAYQHQKIKRALRIIKQPGSAIHKISFNNNKLRKWIFPNRRVGRPRANWAEETVKEIWDVLKKDDNRYKYTAFDGDSEEIINKIKTFEI